MTSNQILEFVRANERKKMPRHFRTFASTSGLPARSSLLACLFTVSACPCYLVISLAATTHHPSGPFISTQSNMSDNEQGSPAAQPEVKPENSTSRWCEVGNGNAELISWWLLQLP